MNDGRQKAAGAQEESEQVNGEKGEMDAEHENGWRRERLELSLVPVLYVHTLVDTLGW